MTRLETKYSALQKDLELKKKESERADSVCSSLKNQVETLRDELKATQKAYQQKMEILTKKLEREFEDKINSLKDTQSSDFTMTMALARKNFDENFLEMKTSSDSEIKSLKEKMIEINKKAEEDMKAADARNVRVLTALEEEKFLHASDVDVLSKRNKKDREEAEEKRIKELEQLGFDLNSAMLERERISQEGHNNIIKSMELTREKVQSKCDVLHFIESSYSVPHDLLISLSLNLSFSLSILHLLFLYFFIFFILVFLHFFIVTNPLFLSSMSDNLTLQIMTADRKSVV